MGGGAFSDPLLGQEAFSWQRLSKLDQLRLAKLFKQTVKVAEIADQVGKRDFGRSGGCALVVGQRMHAGFVIVGRRTRQIHCPCEIIRKNNDTSSWILP